MWPHLDALESRMLDAFASGDEAGLKIIGYGEISAVVAWPEDAPTHACKRLPPFTSAAQLESYRACFEQYLARLVDLGVDVVPSSFEVLEDADVAYCLQPLLDGDRVGPAWLRTASAEEAAAFFERLVAHVLAVVDGAIGLDAQVSNWVVRADGALSYLDVTTPLMRDDDGHERLDADLFLASLPVVLRGPVRRLVLRSILDTYYDPRSVLRDMVANLLKEGLSTLVGPALDAVAGRVEPVVSEAEVRRYYRSDARTWAVMQRLRRLDRSWQRWVRRRPYPFLLPGPIRR